MSLAAGTRLGPYEVISPIGKGGMGEVYRARDTKLDRDIAIKVLPEELRKTKSGAVRTIIVENTERTFDAASANAEIHCMTGWPCEVPPAMLGA